MCPAIWGMAQGTTTVALHHPWIPLLKGELVLWLVLSPSSMAAKLAQSCWNRPMDLGHNVIPYLVFMDYIFSKFLSRKSNVFALSNLRKTPPFFNV